jgi:hypothetical protein
LIFSIVKKVTSRFFGVGSLAGRPLSVARVDDKENAFAAILF